jgi:hypothetical protein
VQSIHSLMLKSGLRVLPGRKVLIFNDLLLQSIPFMALSTAKEEEDQQVLGVVPWVLFYLVCQGAGPGLWGGVKKEQRQPQRQRQRRQIGRFGFAYTPAFGRAEGILGWFRMSRLKPGPTPEATATATAKCVGLSTALRSGRGVEKNKQRQKQSKIRGSFASLRMTIFCSG